MFAYQGPEMGISIQSQGVSFLCAVGLGLAMGLYYDFFRILRRSHKCSVAMVAAQDVLFWVATAIAAMVLFYITGSMELRSFLLLGTAMGWALWQVTFSPFLVRGGVMVLDLTGNLLGKILRLLLAPFLWILRPVCRLVKKLWSEWGRKVRALRCWLRFQWNSKKILRKAGKSTKATCANAEKQIK